jgi:hypothetical protein
MEDCMADQCGLARTCTLILFTTKKTGNERSLVPGNGV